MNPRLMLDVSFAANYPLTELVDSYIKNVPPDQIWAASETNPDIMRHLHQQVRLRGSVGLHNSVPWLSKVCFKRFVT